ncbi:MAG: RnfABCDGE type electron transport complex subunit G [Bacteroidales bacterium]|nr:RnfABCDGE type electron transport complex subunit G [Bacteroidales bacterium]
MAAKSTLVNMALCLFGVCLVCSAILAGTYALTKNPIEEASRKALKEALSKVLMAEGEISSEAAYIDLDGVNYEYYTQTAEADSAVCWAVKSTVIGFGGPLTLLVGVERNGVVHATKVLSHSETPGLGAKCETEESFIRQFEGFESASRSLKVRKDGGEIDAITASTITSRAYAKAVENAVAVAAKIQEGLQ